MIEDFLKRFGYFKLKMEDAYKLDVRSPSFNEAHRQQQRKLQIPHFDKTGWHPWPVGKYWIDPPPPLQKPRAVLIVEVMWDSPSKRLLPIQLTIKNNINLFENGCPGLWWREIKNHQHTWDAPSANERNIQVLLMGEICISCGAKRVYEGPVHGWRILEQY